MLVGSIGFRLNQDCFTSDGYCFKAFIILSQDCTTFCERDFVQLWTSISHITKMIVELICDIEFDRIFVTQFEITFYEFTEVIGTFILSSKLIVELFRERTIFAWSIGFRLENNGFSSDSYIFKALFVSPHNYIVLSEGNILHLRKRGSRNSQSKYFDRGRHADKRGKTRRPCHCVHRRVQLDVHLCLRVYTQVRYCGQSIHCTVALAGARGIDIAIGVRRQSCHYARWHARLRTCPRE